MQGSALALLVLVALDAHAEEHIRSPSAIDGGPAAPGEMPPLPGPAIVVLPEAGDRTAAGVGVVNINQASIDELARLPGIGPAKAQAIVAYRSKSRFVRKEQLLSVRGIGPKLLQQLRPYVVLEGATTLRSKIRSKR